MLVNLSNYINKGKSSGKTHLFKPNKKVELSIINNYQLATQYMRKFFLNFRYLGPVREVPRRHYFINKIGQSTIGSKGEYTSIILAEKQEELIPPYYRCIYDKKAIKKFEHRSSDKMLEALNGWLSFMQLPQLIPTPVIERTISQIKLDSTGVEVCLPDVGFGVSQILPVLVECLRTKSGETIILEQPEIHLHPSLQSKLADFLICMAKAGKKIIVETHSEHLIKRLYLRSAQEESDAIRNLLNTVFVSFDERQQTSITKTIVINKYGEIENWPVGFFDEDDSRELVAATLKKRMGKVRKK
jgi:predicted ATPase